MKKSINLVAFDCGNSSIRVVLGTYRKNRINVETVYQVENTMINVGGYLYWDILKIFSDLKKGLAKAIKKTDRDIASIGICTWGIDFALFDQAGNMLANPLSYRNSMGAEMLSKINNDERKSMFYDTGILCDQINTVYRIIGMMGKMSDITRVAKKLLMVPDIIGYFFTGEMFNESSELSTSQLMNTNSISISENVLNRFSIPKEWFAKIPKHGDLLGYLKDDICTELFISQSIPVVHIASHDTASAIVAVPSDKDEFVFISSGTWSLIGTELDRPVISKKVYEAGFTNELGVFNKITLLKNSAGMFILQKLKKEYEEAIGGRVGWDQITSIARNYQGKPLYFDVNDEAFYNPDMMFAAILEYTGCSTETDWACILYSAYYSLGKSYEKTISTLESVLKKKYETIYIVGGGAQNGLLNQMCADLTGKQVVAGAAESTSLGNIVMQLKYFDKSLTLKDMRNIVRNSIDSKTYEPRNQIS